MVTLAFPLRDLCKSCKLSTLLVLRSISHLRRVVRGGVLQTVGLPRPSTGEHAEHITTRDFEAGGESGHAESASYLKVTKTDVRENSKDRSLVIM
jgi:hypothetical protein